MVGLISFILGVFIGVVIGYGVTKYAAAAAAKAEAVASEAEAEASAAVATAKKDIAKL